MIFPFNGTAYVSLVTRNPTTGVPTNADSTPTASLRLNGSASAVSVTVTNVTTGQYELSFSTATFASGDRVTVTALATVSTVSAASAVSGIVLDLATVDANVDAIKVKTDQLGFTGANVNANVVAGGGGSLEVQVDNYSVRD